MKDTKRALAKITLSFDRNSQAFFLHVHFLKIKFRNFHYHTGSWTNIHTLIRQDYRFSRPAIFVQKKAWNSGKITDIFNSVFRHTTTYGYTQQHPTSRHRTIQHPACHVVTHQVRPHHATTRYDTPQHTEARIKTHTSPQNVTTRHNTPQHARSHDNTLRHATAHLSTH